MTNAKRYSNNSIDLSGCKTFVEVWNNGNRCCTYFIETYGSLFHAVEEARKYVFEWSGDEHPTISRELSGMLETDHDYLKGDHVHYRGRFSDKFAHCGKIEAIDGYRIGVRLDNQNFAWADATQVEPDPDFPARDCSGG